MDFTITLTNTCTCETWNGDDYVPADTCHGDCWTQQVDDFDMDTDHLLSLSTEWRIEGVPTWRGPVSGTFTARTGAELLAAITPERTEWRLTARITDDQIIGILYHHDAPTGGTMTVTPIIEA
jgi:hypothetical protein